MKKILMMLGILLTTTVLMAETIYYVKLTYRNYNYMRVKSTVGLPDRYILNISTQTTTQTFDVMQDAKDFIADIRVSTNTTVESGRAVMSFDKILAIDKWTIDTSSTPLNP